MSVRYRKSTKIGPFRLTATKNGLSVSAGVKGARVSLGSDGKVRRTLSLPGTGMSDTKVIGGSRRVPAQAGQPEAAASIVTRDGDGNFNVTLDPNRRPSVADFRQLQQAGMTSPQMSIVGAGWWEHHDSITPVSRNPFSPNSALNRRIRARRLAKLRAKEAASK
jgi:hypothetical protein